MFREYPSLILQRAVILKGQSLPVVEFGAMNVFASCSVEVEPHCIHIRFSVAFEINQTVFEHESC